MNKPHICFGQSETSIGQNEVFDLLQLDTYDITCVISTNTTMLYVQDKKVDLIERIESLFFTQYLPVKPEHCRIIYILKEEKDITEEYILETLRKEFQVEIRSVKALKSLNEA